MYQGLYTMITAKLAALGFANIGSSLDDQPPLPAVQVYMHEDKEVTQRPGAHREVTYIVQLTMGPDANDDAQVSDLHNAMDTIRDGFAGWRTETVGITEPVSVPKITIAAHKGHGATQYMIFIVFRVIPATFHL